MTQHCTCAAALRGAALGCMRAELTAVWLCRFLLHAGCASSTCCSRSTNACLTPTVQGAWKRGQTLAVHGLIYNPADGSLKVGTPLKP